MTRLLNTQTKEIVILNPTSPLYLLRDEWDWISEEIVKSGAWESKYITKARQFLNKESTVLDIGANLGAWSIALSPHVKSIWAFEPQIRTFNQLCGNLFINNCHNVIPVRCALSISIDKYRRLKIHDEWPANNGAAHISQIAGERIDIFTLDDFIPKIGRVDLLKVDVEGWECKVLIGGEELIRRDKPVIFFEALASKPQESAQTLDWLKKAEYQIAQIDDNDYLAIHKSKIVIPIPENDPVINQLTELDFTPEALHLQGIDVMEKPTVCLSMIVKNEAHCVKECLESVKPYITYWIISDTGSTDDTEKVVRDTLEGIPGEYRRDDWTDFSTNRNIALNEALDKADYILIMDADDVLEAEDNSTLQNLTENAYKFQIKHETITYPRVQLFKSSLKPKYISPVHEYLTVDPWSAKLVESAHVIHNKSQGSRSKDPNKYVKDAELLEKALADEPDNGRYVFYCGQSWRDALTCSQIPTASPWYRTKAIARFLQRGDMGGYTDERYVALLEAGKLMRTGFEPVFLKAHNLYPIRTEALVYLARAWRLQDEHDRAYFFAKNAINISKPSEGLFIEDACYGWKRVDELAIAAYYIGKKQESRALNQFLLEDKTLPESEKKRIEKNLEFCL